MRFLLHVSVIFLAIPHVLSAAPITFVYSGIASGVYDRTFFTDTQFTITGVADTDDRKPNSRGTIINTPHQATLVTIAGLGTYQLDDPVQSFLVPSRGTVGLARTAPRELLLMEVWNPSVLSDWDMITSIGLVEVRGPVEGSLGGFTQWTGSISHKGITANNEILFFQGFIEEGSFAASLVPEPSAFTILFSYLGLSVLYLARLRTHQFSTKATNA